MSPEDHTAIAAFAASKPARTNIRDYLHASDGSVNPSSALALDDKCFPHNPTSQIAWVAMISASEHLDIVEAILELAPKRTFVTAPYTTVRGALISSAQALAVLGAPGRVDRQQRSLSIAIEYLTQLTAYNREQLKLCSPAEKQRVQAQIDKVYQPTLDEAMSKRKKGYRYNDTNAIATAVGYRFSGNVDHIRTTVDLHWRRLGGDAHALGWTLLFGDMIWSGDDPDKLGAVSISGRLADVVETSSWAFQFLSEAVDLHKKMSS